MVDAGTEAVKSLLEAPIEKPVLLSEAALENLYNISHNVQEYFLFGSIIYWQLIILYSFRTSSVTVALKKIKRARRRNHLLKERRKETKIRK